MTKSTYMKVNFNGGELSPFLDGRIDYPKYASGAKEMTNFVPTVYGPMTKRPGTRFVQDIGEEAVLYPFEFSESQAYIFAFVNMSIKVYTGDGILLDDMNNPVILTSPYTLQEAKELKFAQTGDIVYFTHQIRGMQKYSRTSANTFDSEKFEPLNGPFQDENTDETLTLKVARTANNPDGTPSEVDIEASQAIFRLSDVGALIKIGYIPSTRWDTWEPESHTFNGTDITYNAGDYIQYENRIYEVTGADTGVTLPSRTGTRAPLHEKGERSDGKLKLTYVSDDFGYVRIRGVGAEPSTIANCDVVKQFPPGIVGEDLPNPTPDYGPETDEWAWGSFGGQYGWPNAIIFHQQRMVLGGGPNQPQTIWGSVIGDIENFTEGTDDDKAYEFTIAANKKNPIEWLETNVLLNVGTLGSEFFVSSSGSSITPTDINIQQIGTYGSAQNVAPLIANGFTLFVQAGGRKLRELRFDEDSQRNFARDLNKVAEHISFEGINRITYQAEPYQVIWTVIGETLYGLTYESDEDVYAWHKQDAGTIKSITTIPNNGEDRLWLCIERNGNFYIEYMTDFFERNDDILNAVFSDSSLEYDGPETSTISGLDHLEGEEVVILADGSVQPRRTVTSGEITLQYPASKVIVGLPLPSAWQSMRLEGGSQEGIAQGKSKHLKNIVLRLDATGAGLMYGRGDYIQGVPTSEYSSLYPVRTTVDNMDNPPPLVFGDTDVLGFEGGWDKSYFVRFEHNDPVPCTIISFMSQVETNER